MKLRVLAGPNPSALSPIPINNGQVHPIVSELFEGKVVVYIKGLPPSSSLEDAGASPWNAAAYFGNSERASTTWSIQVQGRFLTPFSADDVLFGNTFDRPLKLPWGTSAILKFMNYIDPTLEHDLQSTTKPWALSPLIATMPYFAHRRMDTDTASAKQIEFPMKTTLVDDTSELYHCYTPPPTSSPGDTNDGDPSFINLKYLPSPRRSFFSTPEHRRFVTFGPDDSITTDFCYGFLSFTPSPDSTGNIGSDWGTGPRLEISSGLSFDLGHYWDGQPVRFVCCERKRPRGGSDGRVYPEDDEPWGRTFWCVAIEIVEDDGNEEEEEGNDGGKGEQIADSDMINDMDKGADDID
ncbi:hypothetical protein EST38_g1930 [Candolleomyces aberdarensis]|uniref:Domain of unknown function at the cortex 1 domain-containing protein n=1 Tax=Candolleomyces aberdarensis TaxID=2316362 RepID=A0A4Q2DU73_9AGAR|nr:hypothetical protein EST38_g1930 [Candolleomyces aberdarensis]